MAVIDMGLFCMMLLWSVPLDVSSFICLAVSVGLSVDYVLHIAHAVEATSGSGEERAVAGFQEIGISVVKGGCSTFLGILGLAFSPSELYIIFFKMLFSAVVLGLLVGVAFFPACFSLLGHLVPVRGKRHPAEAGSELRLQAGLPLLGVIPLDPLASFRSAGREYGVAFLRRHVVGLGDGIDLILADYRDFPEVYKREGDFHYTDVVAKFFTRAFGGRRHEFDVFSQGKHAVLQHLSSQAGITNILSPYVQELRDRVAGVPLGKEMRLLKVIRMALAPAMARGVFGEGFLSSDSDWKAFRKFEPLMFGLASGVLPQWWPAARAFQALCAGRVREFDFERSSMFIRGLVERAKGKASIDDSAITASLVGLSVATMGQSLPTLYWVLAFTLTHREALLAVRAEARVFASTGHHIEDIPKINHVEELPVLESIFWEVTRLLNLGMILREATQDTTLNLPSQSGRRVDIRKGQLLMLLGCIPAVDPEIFPEPEKFVYDRFMPKRRGSPKLFFKQGVDVTRLAGWVFGGGTGMCPGRFMAKAAIKQAVLVLLNEMKMDLSDPHQPLPQKQYYAQLPEPLKSSDLRVAFGLLEDEEDEAEEQGEVHEMDREASTLSGITGTSSPVSRRSTGNATSISVLYSSQTGTAAGLAARAAAALGDCFGKEVDVVVFDVYALDQRTIRRSLRRSSIVVFFCSTYGDGESPFGSEHLLPAISRSQFPHLLFATFALGSSIYQKFNNFGKLVHSTLEAQGATPLLEVALADASVHREDAGSMEDDYEAWLPLMLRAVLQHTSAGSSGQAEMPAQMVVDNMIRANRKRQAERVLQASRSAVSFTLSAAEAESLMARHNSGKRSQRVHRAFVQRIAGDRLVEMPSEADAGPMNTPETGSAEVSWSPPCKRMISVEVTLPEGMAYEHGDHLCVFPRNSATLVGRAARLLRCDVESFVVLGCPVDKMPFEAFPTPCPLKEALARFCDLTSAPSRQTLFLAAGLCTEESEQVELRELAEGSAYHEQVVQSRSGLIDLLERFPSCRPCLTSFFLALAPRLQPRLYSIASAPMASKPRAATLCVSVVRERVEALAAASFAPPGGREFEGLCSNCLRRTMDEGPAELDMYVRRANFRLPTEPATPVVMIGPGSGIAPFRGFCQELAAKMSKEAEDVETFGPALLFTGFRTLAEVPYEKEFQHWVQSGVLAAFHLAISRPPDMQQKSYVQDHLWEHRASVADAIRGGGHLYICGDAQGMARQVETKLCEILVDRGLTADMEEARLHLDAMATARRYQKDVYQQRKDDEPVNDAALAEAGQSGEEDCVFFV
eukprot:TRINITY_DN668_c2_g1_i1.p1 TRINITY_DN668_c2_g1~~TRINITY_DN668_c2_g1_i1.p1  ORF type:complete len:1325 (-),score=185.29 TRINITY_DN668_c2_g1_i1:113-4033(-)